MGWDRAGQGYGVFGALPVQTDRQFLSVHSGAPLLPLYFRFLRTRGWLGGWGGGATTTFTICEWIHSNQTKERVPLSHHIIIMCK